MKRKFHSFFWRCVLVIVLAWSFDGWSVESAVALFKSDEPLVLNIPNNVVTEWQWLVTEID